MFNRTDEKTLTDMQEKFTKELPSYLKPETGLLTYIWHSKLVSMLVFLFRDIVHHYRRSPDIYVLKQNPVLQQLTLMLADILSQYKDGDGWDINQLKIMCATNLHTGLDIDPIDTRRYAGEQRTPLSNRIYITHFRLGLYLLSPIRIFPTPYCITSVDERVLAAVAAMGSKPTNPWLLDTLYKLFVSSADTKLEADKKIEVIKALVAFTCAILVVAGSVINLIITSIVDDRIANCIAAAIVLGIGGVTAAVLSLFGLRAQQEPDKMDTRAATQIKAVDDAKKDTAVAILGGAPGTAAQPKSPAPEDAGAPGAAAQPKPKPPAPHDAGAPGAALFSKRKPPTTFSISMASATEGFSSSADLSKEYLEEIAAQQAGSEKAATPPQPPASPLVIPDSHPPVAASPHSPPASSVVLPHSVLFKYLQQSPLDLSPEALNRAHLQLEYGQ